MIRPVFRATAAPYDQCGGRVLGFRNGGSASCRGEPNAVMFRINVAEPRVLYRLYRDRRNPGTLYQLYCTMLVDQRW